ncbi:AzlC family ABC transporter permease [Micrococcus sp.]|uniref:AzlC family ABC transporter permease n=1 Tax=Micrococcus sp. TaxID=1271 RepID=UPI002A9200D8|nr:AzlC family ABC transporter permease [Micrococcus sp.]MDY6054319.1 AzlC family ABC transporter permease [Micrococcus sp.]
MSTPAPPPHPSPSAPEPAATLRAEIAEGIRLSGPAGLGLFPLGLAFGMLVLQAGLPGWAAPLLSSVVFAGSVELLLIGLITAGLPLVSIAVTVLLVNFRHVFYAFSFPLHVVRHPLARIYSMGALIDEAYAIAAAHPQGWTAPRLLAMQASLQAYWVLGGVAGVVLAGLLPAPVEGLEFALTALFIVLALDAARSRRQVPLVLAAAASVGVGLFIAPSAVLVTAFVCYLVVLVAAHLALGRGEHGPRPAVETSPEVGP